MHLSPRLSKGQSVYLDFARAMAALTVLFGHASVVFLQGSAFQKMDAQVGAVPVFFLISGFLISLSVFQKHANRAYGFSDYFIDRFCRIYSVFVPSLFFVLLIDWLVVDNGAYSWKNSFTVQAWFGNLFMLQDFPVFQILRRLGVPDNKWFVTSFGSAGPFWTISIEWWIYMLFGYLAYFRVRTGKPFGPAQWLIVMLLAIEPAYHFVGGPDRCLTMLWVLGMGASFLFLKLPAIASSWTVSDRQWRYRLCAVSAAAVMAMILHSYADKFHQENTAVYHETAGGITEFQMGVYLAVAIFALFFALAAINRVPALIEKPVKFLADYSYSLYLTHSSVLVFMQAHAANAAYNPTLFWQATIAANMVAIFFWWAFERHHRVLADALKRMAYNRLKHRPA